MPKPVGSPRAGSITDIVDQLKSRVMEAEPRASCMKKLTNFLKLLLLNMISIGEQKVWLSGALLQLLVCGLWLYAIFGSLYNSSDTLITDWLIGILVVLLIITMLSLATGGLRNKLGFKSIKPEREVISSYAKYKIEGLASFFNGLVVLFIIMPVIVVFLEFVD